MLKQVLTVVKSHQRKLRREILFGKIFLIFCFRRIMETVIGITGSILSAGLFCYSNNLVKENDRMRNAAFSKIPELTHSSVNNPEFGCSPVVGQLLISDSKSAVLSLKRQAVVTTSTLVPDVAVDLRALFRESKDEGAVLRPQLRVQEQCVLKYGEKRKFLSDPTFGTKHIQPSAAFSNDQQYRPLKDFKTKEGLKEIHGGEQMQKLLKTIHGVDVKLNAESMYQLNSTSLQDRSIYLVGRKCGTAFIYDRIGIDPSTLINLHMVAFLE
jgi:hypothetical protein